MIINKYLTLLATIALLATPILTSCSSEDEPEADIHNPTDFFRPADGDNSEEAQLRRSFFEKYGSYLLFNDTLQRKLLGTDINGDPRYFVETVDLTYTIGQTGYGSSQVTYSFTYLDTWEKKTAIHDFASTFILPHFNGAFRPYSWLLTNVITGKLGRSINAETSRPYAAVGQRCIAIAGNYLLLRDRTDAQKTNYANRVLNIIVGEMVKMHSGAFADFYSVSADYYTLQPSDVSSSGSLKQEDYYRYGFLGKGGGALSSTLTTRDADLSAYANSIITTPEETIKSRYADYPLVLQKYDIMRSILTELGYVF